MDFTKLRAAALRDGDDEEAVTVNTRALIDKVLARYSGEWTTLRELLQNAADAQASKVVIKFETMPSAQVPLANTTSPSEVLKHVLLHHTLRRLLVTNNGQVFGVNDWNRLKRIAEGNPDETKIGAFGVGFYSVFADCEEPFVSSGNEAMAFYWKTNSLFTRRLQLPSGQGNPDTSFVLDYRNTTTPMPNLLSIAQFLATSLTFVALQHIELWVDEYKIISLQKKTAPSAGIPIPRDVETRTKEGLMQVRGLEKESVQMDATFMNVIGWKPSILTSVSKSGNYDNPYGSTSSDVPSMRSFFSRLTNTVNQNSQKSKAAQEAKALQEIVLEDLTATTTANVFLKVTTAAIKTTVNSQFAAELERATKKPPPKTTKLAILTSGYDETSASTEGSTLAKHVDIFASVLPSKKPGGRIFIGFPTHQTTGAGMHLSAPSVIPTVERESIDLNARWVRTWNIEMLRVAGIMTRLAYTSEMADLSAKIKRAAELAGQGSKIAKEQVDHFIPEALHTLSTFTFGDSTPSSQVAQIIEEAFWTTYKKPSIEVFSSRGVLLTNQVRLATEDLGGFVESIPVIPEALVNAPYIKKLKDFGLLTEITHSDVKQELASKALTSSQLTQLITWAAKKAGAAEMDRAMIASLFDVVVATVGEEDGQGDVITLGSVTNFLSTTKLPPDVPLPPTAIPFAFTKGIPDSQLYALGWSPLEIVPWLRFLVETNASRKPELSLATSVPFASKVLQTLSKAWETNIHPSSRGEVVTLLRNITIVPTKFGLKRPGESYFPSVKIFDDLPTVTLSGVKEKVLLAIGVRKTVDLDTVFKRLLSPPTTDEKRDGAPPKSRHVELITYLASVKDDIPAADMQKLKGHPIFPAEDGPPGKESTSGTVRLYKISELFAPDERLRKLKLPILQWPGEPGSFRPNSTEGLFLFLLGLRKIPSVPELIDLMAVADPQMRNLAMSYFIANHQINGYNSFEVASTDKKILPVQGKADVVELCAPTQCFTNENCSILGFKILQSNLRSHASKFGVAANPPVTECVNRLISRPPMSRSEAVKQFEYFSTRLAEIGQNNVVKLSDAKIVPLQGQKSEKSNQQRGVTFLKPQHCYLGSSSSYEDIFDFIDFGTNANLFLTKCGAKTEPTKLELADMACREPVRLFTALGTPEKYMNLLGRLAEDLDILKRDKVLFKRMKASKFLLGFVIVSGNKNNKTGETPHLLDGNGSEDELDEVPIKMFEQISAADVVIIDDFTSYQLFKGSLICAPEEEKLEDFYRALGAPTLSSLVEVTHRLGSVNEKQESAVKLRNHILERSKLFLHQTPNNEIQHDARWLEKHLAVQVVSSISLRRALRGRNISNVEHRTAHITHERHTGWLLYVTPKYDHYQISMAICRIILERAKQQHFLSFESFLNLNLIQLRSRGVNVERILRAKATEERVAEADRRKQLEAEQKNIREQEELWRSQNQDQQLEQIPQTPSQKKSQKGQHVPGAFGSDSPEAAPSEPAQKQRSGFLSNFTRRLGLDNHGEAQQQLQRFLGGDSHNEPPQPSEAPPPSYDQVTKPKQAEKVSSPAAVQQNLVNAIQASRAHDSESVFSPPSTNEIKEQASYCDSTPSQNIKFLADTPAGMRIYVERTLATPKEFLSENSSTLNSFSTLLYEVGDVYNLPRKSLHIFYDEEGGTIAFNLNGSVFCNFRFWQQLHQKKMIAPGILGSTVGEGRVEAAAYWWTVIAHELAHNLVKPHNAEHSFYTEMLMSNYFPKMMSKASGFLERGGEAKMKSVSLD